MKTQWHQDGRVYVLTDQTNQRIDDALETLSLNDTQSLETLLTHASPPGGWAELWRQLAPQENQTDNSAARALIQAQISAGRLQLFQLKKQAPAVTATSTQDKPRQATAGYLQTPLQGHAVSMVTGEVLLSLEALTVPGPIPFVWRRFYRSGENQDAGLGCGWSHSGQESLTLYGDRVILRDDEGRALTFNRPALGQRVQHRAEGMELHFSAQNQFILRRALACDQVFTRHGRAERFVLSEIRHGGFTPGGIDRDGHRRADRGYVLRLHHNTAGRVIRMMGNWGRGLGFERDERGRITAVYQLDTAHERLQPALARYHYDGEGDLIQYHNSAGAVERYTYENHVLIQQGLSTGFRWHWDWDQHTILGRCRRSWGDEGVGDTQFQWQEDARRSQATDSAGVTRCYQYDAYGNTRELIDGEGQTWRYEYDQGLCVERIDPLGQRTRYFYNTDNRLSGYEDALGQTAAADYFNTQLTRFTDVDQASWEREYDARGQLKMLRDPQGGQTQFEYNTNGLMQRVIDANKGSWRLSWDAQAQLIECVDVFGSARRYDYDDWGRLVGAGVYEKNKNLRQIQYRYTEAGQLRAVISDNGERSDFYYDAHQRLVRCSDAQGRISEYAYDALDRLIRRTDALGHSRVYTYDSEGQCISQSNENGELATFSYDACSRLLEETGFDGRRLSYRYDARGALIECVDSERVRTSYTRDALGRMLSRCSRRAHDPDNGPSETDKYRYDAKGRLIEAYNSDRYLAFAYNKCGDLIEERTQARNKKGQLIKDAEQILRYRYDAGGRCEQLQLPSGGTIDWTYHASGAWQVQRYNTEPISEVVRDATGRAKQRKDGVLRTQYVYDEYARLCAQRMYKEGADQALFEQHYEYDPYARIARISDAQGDTDFTYDAVDRLRVSAQERFEYDPAGNILDARHAPLSGQVKGNRLKFFEDVHLAYDARGNRVEERRGRAGGVLRLLTYDFQNRLTQVIEDDQRTAYVYDPLGRRVEKHHDTGKTRYLWSRDTLIQEQYEGHLRCYLYETDDARPLAMIEQGVVYYFHLDPSGLVRLICDGQGQIVWKARYLAWAAIEQMEIEEIQNNLRLPGQYYDAESALHYNRHRYYDPVQGRYISQGDLGDARGKNPYVYAPNPLMWNNINGLHTPRARTGFSLQPDYPQPRPRWHEGGPEHLNFPAQMQQGLLSLPDSPDLMLGLRTPERAVSTGRF